MPEREETRVAASRSDLAILRRYLSDGNEASYRVDPLTLAQIEGSYRPRTTLTEARAALTRLEAASEGRALLEDAHPREGTAT